MNLFYTRPDPCWNPGVFPEPALITISLNGAPEFLHGKRMLFFSDVHLRKQVSQDRLHQFIARIAAVEADMILMGGDYAEGSDQCLRFFKAFKGVSCPLGCYAAVGNNDFDSAPAIAQIMADAGVRLLKNAAQLVALSGGRIQIGGCDDHKYGAPRTRSLFSDEPAYRILLSHYPVQPDCRCDLMLSGHTHAGQCNLLGLTPYSFGFEWNRRLLGVRGLHKIGDMQLLIGNGVGVSRFPFRLGAQPQIYLLLFS